MAAQRYDAVAAREYERNGEKKTAFTNIGVAFPMKDRDGYSLRLHAIPAPTDGEYTILLFPPKPRADQQPRQQSEQSMYGGEPGSRELDDDLPF